MNGGSSEGLSAASEGRIAFTELSLMLVYRCNFRCRDCLVGDKLADLRHLTFEEGVQIIEGAAALRTIHVIGFVGGEPFIAYKTMRRLAEYTWNHYRCGLTASTNSSWATSDAKALSLLEPLYSYGMRWILLSWDDFHAEFAPITRLINAIKASQKLGIAVTIQNIVTKGATSNATIRERLKDEVDVNAIQWVENPAVPVGLGGEGIHDSEKFFLQELPYGGCNAGTVLSIEVDGQVKPCCGAAFMNPHLKMGNVLQEPLRDVVNRASLNPIFNSLVAFRGPRHLMDTLMALGRPDLVPRRFVDACDACSQLMNNSEARRVLSVNLASQAPTLIAARMASQFGDFLKQDTISSSDGSESSPLVEE
jgi:MoaA/NifB/PqqE/SkfB family radical SAM enzyme